MWGRLDSKEVWGLKKVLAIFLQICKYKNITYFLNHKCKLNMFNTANHLKL